MLQPRRGRTGPVTVRGADIVLDPTAVVDPAREAIDGRARRDRGLSGGRLDGAVRHREIAAIQTVRPTSDMLEALQLVAAVAALAVAILVVLLAHRRLRALRIVGIALAFAGLITILRDLARPAAI